MLTLRPYQEEAVASVYEHLRTRDDNPCVVIPTGGGKTPVMAVGGWVGAAPKGTAPIHSWWVVKEKSGGQLVEQTTHTVDLARYLIGEAVEVWASAARGFVKGAYVEGVVSSGDPNARGEGGGNAEGGVLLELMLPSDIVWAGQYGPGQTWSLDLDWRP